MIDILVRGWHWEGRETEREGDCGCGNWRVFGGRRGGEVTRVFGCQSRNMWRRVVCGWFVDVDSTQS